jgi:hypothetical protein
LVKIFHLFDLMCSLPWSSWNWMSCWAKVSCLIKSSRKSKLKFLSPLGEGSALLPTYYQKSLSHQALVATMGGTLFSSSTHTGSTTLISYGSLSELCCFLEFHWISALPFLTT